MSGQTPPPAITFRPLTADDLPMLHGWLARPHVAAWWGALPTPDELAEEFAPALAGSPSHQAFVALAGGTRHDGAASGPMPWGPAGTPIGFTQFYVPVDCHHEGWWLDEHDPGVRGIDQFLAHADQLGQGLGTAMVRAFVAHLFADPAVTRIQTDPDPTNRRAVRCYEKSGFRAAREIDTPDGRALLMYCERPAGDPQ